MIKDKTPTPAPFQIIGNIAGKPVFLRSNANKVILSYNGIDKCFPNRDAALLYMQSICRRNTKEVINNAVKR